MFSNQVIDTDKFRMLGQSAQALYYALGMDADDEGFASFKKAEKLYGFTLGDLKSLHDRGFVEVFQSGVVAIVHWHVNNWLDSRRVKPTIYQKEFRQLHLTGDRVYVLSTDAKQMLSEYRIEENSLEQASTQKTEEERGNNEVEKKSEILYKTEKQRRRELYKIELEKRKEREEEEKKEKEDFKIEPLNQNIYEKFKIN